MPSGRGGRHAMERGVEEGLDLVRDAIKDLLARPKEERDLHLAQLRSDLEAMLPTHEEIDPNSATARRLKALARVIKTLEEVSARR
jgi:hypothetical protein